MGQVAAEIRSIAHDRVRDALLDLTRDGPEVLTPRSPTGRPSSGITETILRELETDGPFEIEAQPSSGEPRWWVA